MAPGKRKGEADSSKFQVGDLVLAKVKGYPLWPAKIGIPEKWRMPPDPKKYFVEFFGTSEIAFVAPADIQAFNKETKEKLRARCDGGKTVKFFAQAVEQICTVFDEKQNKSSRASPHNYGNKRIDHEINEPLPASGLTSTSPMEVELQERILKANNVIYGKHVVKPKRECKSSEKEIEDPSYVSASVPVSRRKLVTSIAQTEEETSFPKDEGERGIVKKKADEMVDVVIALEASANCKRGRDISATGEGSSTQSRKKTSCEVKSKDSSERGARLSKKPFKGSIGGLKGRDLSEGSLLKSGGSAEKNASLSGEALQVNTKDQNDNDVRKRGPEVNKEANGRIKGKSFFKKGPETTIEALAGKVSKTNTEVPHKTMIEVKCQGSSENGTKGENVNATKEISKIDNVHSKEKVQEQKTRDLSERRREMEGNAQKMLSSSGPAVKKHQLSAEETPPAVKRSKLFERPVSSGEISKTETKLDTHASENSDRKRGLVKRSCLFNEGEESEGKRTPVHRKPSLKLENQKKATVSPQQVKVPEKRVDKFGRREHDNKHVNLEIRTGSLFTVKSTQERIRVKTQPTHEKDSFLVDRLEIGNEDKQDATSMKHLIAVAQAKRRESHSHVPPALAPATSPMLASTNPPTVLLSESNGKHHVSSPSHETQTMVLTGSGSDGSHDPRAEAPSPNLNSAQRLSARGGSLSCGTEAAVARDAFEGMVETLSRTKESIGRATRLAIDCAKYGIATEVVELLVGKLEAEADMHRKVDLFFLIDSITQCSNSQRGVAGSSYIPVVQAALPRILGAAAPGGENARENRRQCLKVLRLWLERRILPDDLLKSCMDDIELPKEEKNPEFLLRRPSRAERSIDDPIREMDGMHVDEYGSNAGFKLPGLFCSNLLQEDSDEEDFPTTSNLNHTSSNNNTSGNSSPLKPTNAHNLPPDPPATALSYEWAPPLPVDPPPLPPPLPSSPPPLPVSPPPSPPPLPPESPAPPPPPPLPESPPPLPPPPPENHNSPSMTLPYYPPPTLSQTTYMQYPNSSTHPSTNVQFQPSSVPLFCGGLYPPQGQLSSNSYIPQPSMASYIQQPNTHYASSNDQWRMTSTGLNTEGSGGNNSAGWVGGVGSSSGSLPAPISYEGYLRSNVEVRPSTNPSPYQLSLHANIPSSAPLPGHQLPHGWRSTR